MAGGLAGVSYEDDHAAAVISAMRQCVGSQKHSVIDGSSRTVGDFADRRLKSGHIVGKPGRMLLDIFIEGKNRQAISGPNNLADKMSRGFLLKRDFFVCAHARVNHQREVERQGSFRLEDVDFLLVAFIEKLKGFAWQIRGRAIVLVENADQHSNQIDVDANAVALDRWR